MEFVIKLPLLTHCVWLVVVKNVFPVHFGLFMSANQTCTYMYIQMLLGVTLFYVICLY